MAWQRNGKSAERPKRPGRPRIEPAEGERVQLSFRVTPELKRRLTAAADKSGRSQSQEAEFRLERSFWADITGSSSRPSSASKRLVPVRKGAIETSFR